MAGEADSRIGATLGRYRVVERLGRGGMGLVYVAEDTNLHRKVALKVLAPEAVKDPERRKRLLREARTAAAASHPCIATIHEVGEEGGEVFLAMELVKGKPLASLIAKNASGLPLDEVARIGEQIARALAAAHEAGVVHRDLKPDNVLVSEDGHVKVLDFGLAKVVETDAADHDAETASVITQEGRILGTPAYMSPEQAKGRDVDERSDVFSLGVILYEMVGGKRPFAGQTTLELLIAIDRDAPTALRSLRADVPEDLEKIVSTCLAKSPQDRFARAAEVASALRAWSGASGAVSKPSLSGPDEVGLKSLDTPEASLLPTREDKPRARARSRGWMLGLAVLAMAASGAFVWTRPGANRGAQPTLEAGASASAPAPAGTGILDLPEPKGCKPEALAEVKSARRSFRQEGWSAAHRHLLEAVRLDPECAEAQFRLSLTGRFQMSTAEERAAYQHAQRLRDSLTERDRGWLDALDVIVQESPPNEPEYLVRMKRLALRFPNDAEIICHVAFESREPALMLEYGARGVQIDPGDADCHQTIAAGHRATGDAEAAGQALDRCIEAAPMAQDCVLERVLHERPFGKCAEIESDAKRMIARGVESWESHLFLAEALASQGSARDAVDFAAQQAVPHYPESERLWRKLEVAARVAALYGDFEASARLELELARAIGDTLEREPLQRWARGRIDRLLEIGDTAGAAQTAKAFVTKIPALHETLSVTYHVADLAPFDLYAQSIAREQRSTADPQWRRTRDAWAAAVAKGMLKPPSIWAIAEAMPAETRADAETALAKMPPTVLEMKPLLLARPFIPGAFAYAGRAHILAGRPKDAAALLEKETTACMALSDPYIHTRASLWLGDALRETGDKSGACRAYAFVLERWGRAKPRSVTEDKARKRAGELKCEGTP